MTQDRINLCTLFNVNYLSRGLVLYDSLVQHAGDFHLFVLAFDDTTYNFLADLQLPQLTPISLFDFENEDLLRVKKDRTAAEYCWTCSASSIHYCLEKYQLQQCTYIDADMQFFADPRLILNELGSDHSVLITAHRYSPEYDQSAISGRYCVQFVTFNNDEKGQQVLNWWKDACIDWCFARVEDGKFGDQKYLDEFAHRFEGVHEVTHPGSGLAPWNVQQFKVVRHNDQLQARFFDSAQTFPVIFYHFHGVKFYNDQIVCLSGPLYALNEEVIRDIYQPYVRLLLEKETALERIRPGMNSNGRSGKSPQPPMNAFLHLKILLSEIKNSPLKNIVSNSARRVTHHYYFDHSKW